jgi:hypothetical protein
MPKQTLIKQYATKGRILSIRGNAYQKDMRFLNLLSAELKRAEPSLTDADIHIVIYAGDHYNGQYGAHANLPEGLDPPASYEVIPYTEDIK